MSTHTNDGGPAFPVPNSSYPNGEVQWGEYGMSLRDWFAGQAMQALIGTNPKRSHFWDDPQGIFIDDWLSRNAYGIADAMIAARNNTNTTAQ